jgi:hypothetical protein
MTQETKVLFGLAAVSVPNTALEGMAPFMHHWWRKNGDVHFSEKEAEELEAFYFCAGKSSSSGAFVATWYYADGYEFDPATGKYNLTGDIVEFTVSTSAYYINGGWSSYSSVDWALIVGHYVARATAGAPEVLYISEETKLTRLSDPGSGARYSLLCGPVLVRRGSSYLENAEYDHSIASGQHNEEDGYTYLGTPLDRAIRAIRHAGGSYIGTDTYGESNPNSLTFDFEPVLVFVFQASGGLSAILAPTIASGNNGGTVVRLEGRTVYWYSTSASGQSNVNGTEYKFVAVGI